MRSLNSAKRKGAYFTLLLVLFLTDGCRCTESSKESKCASSVEAAWIEILSKSNGGRKMTFADVPVILSLIKSDDCVELDPYFALFKQSGRIDERNPEGMTALMNAMQNGTRPDVIGKLIQAGADVNARDTDGAPAIIHARDVKTIQVLITAGAKLDAQDKYGDTALIHAATNHDVDLVAFLLEAKANPNHKNLKGMTAIGAVLGIGEATSDQLQTFDLLLSRGASVATTSDTGMTPLMWVARFDSERLEKLLQAGASTSDTDSTGWQVIHHFVEGFGRMLELDKRHLASAESKLKLLLANGVSINDVMKNDYATTPLQLAELYNLTQMRSLLIKYGAKER